MLAVVVQRGGDARHSGGGGGGDRHVLHEQREVQLGWMVAGRSLGERN